MTGPVNRNLRDAYGKPISGRLAKFYMKSTTPLKAEGHKFFEFNQANGTPALGVISQWRNTPHYKHVEAVRHLLPSLDQKISGIELNLEPDRAMPILKGISKFEHISLAQLTSEALPDHIIKKLYNLSQDLKGYIKDIEALKEPFLDPRQHLSWLEKDNTYAVGELNLLPRSNTAVTQRASRILNEYQKYLTQYREAYNALNAFHNRALHAEMITDTFLNKIRYLL